MTFRAAVFDLDGTLVDNIPFHFKAWQEMGKKLGVEITHERFERDFSGRKNDEIFPSVLGRPVPKDELDALAEEKESRYRELYGPEMKPLPGAVELLERLKGAGFKLAVASAAPRKNRELVLDGLSLRRFFDAVIGSEDAPRGKPHPDIFLAAAKAVGVAPRECVAFEDAVLGTQAAVAAGMRTATLTTTTTEDELRAAGAEWTSRDFTELSPELLKLLALV